MGHTSFLGDIQEGEHLRMDWKGLWVSLAYTRAFGTLGLQFKSGQTHHFPLSKVNLFLKHRSLMASRWNVMQNKPKKKRRTSLDLYEFCTFMLFVSLGSIGLMILLKLPSGTFDHVSDERNGIIGLGFLLSGWALIRFDASARRRAREKYDYDLAEYELIRTKFLEMEAAKLELQKEYSIQYMSSTGNNAIIIDPGVSESKEVQSDDTASDDE